MKSLKSNPAGQAYPRVAPNSTLGGMSNQGRTVTAEPGRASVNVAQGPKTGNAGDMDKRKAFMANKAEAEPVARVIQNAYAARSIKPYADPRMEGISPDTKPRSRSR